jgi:hypothetical protein
MLSGRILRLTAVASVLPAIAVAAGCGGSPKKHVSRAHTSIRAASGDNCDAKGISGSARREGVCTAGGFRVVVVNKAHWLHMQGYDVRILGMRPAVSLKPRSGPVRSHGRFLVVTLSVKSRLASPQRFDNGSNLVQILINKKTFSENAEAEADPTIGSFASRTVEIQPDEVNTGTVVFDLPVQDYRDRVAQGSDLVFLDANSQAGVVVTGSSALQTGAVPTAGYIRLWK